VKDRCARCGHPKAHHMGPGHDTATGIVFTGGFCVDCPARKGSDWEHPFEERP